MLHHCLNLEQLVRFIEVEIEGKELYEDEYTIRYLFNDWYTWDVELVCITQTLSRVMERKQKEKKDVHAILSSIFQISSETGFLLTFEEIDETFVNYMFGFDRQGTLNIEEQLIEIYNQFRDYNY